MSDLSILDMQKAVSKNNYFPPEGLSQIVATLGEVKHLRESYSLQVSEICAQQQEIEKLRERVKFLEATQLSYLQYQSRVRERKG